jgi:hypothetical protein
MQKVLLIALAGACGTLARYGLAGLVQVKTGSAFPFGTLAVNLIGCTPRSWTPHKIEAFLPTLAELVKDDGLVTIERVDGAVMKESGVTRR